MTYLTKPINLKVDEIPTKRHVARSLGVPTSAVKGFVLHKKSIDARKKDAIRVVCTFVAEVDGTTPKTATPYVKPSNVIESLTPASYDKTVVVVGSGPAGLFCALYLSKAGARVIVVERGSNVDKRKQDVEAYFNGGDFNANSNIQFGLGGAGTFSDGKLTTGISSPLLFTVFDTFVKCGAPSEIMCSNTPHVGTDNLVRVVASMRDEITSHGGTFLFDTLVSGVNVVDGKVVSVEVKSNNKAQTLFCNDVVFAVGHSARDTFYMLHSCGVEMQFKPFAVGVRIEHERSFISQLQYGNLANTHRDFQSANYKLAVNLPNGRSCYSFCMCPGGVVVAGNSTPNTIVVNGMSNFDRLAPNSNSALVVNVTQDDVGQGVFAGVKFQQRLEEACFNAVNSGNHYLAPAQNVVDFLHKRKSTEWSVTPSYPRGVVSANLWDILPAFVCNTLAEALVDFGKKMHGFDKCGVLTAVESRTSSPVKMLRDKQSFASTTICNLYPCGEGAGYAGGIVSASVDGLKVAQAICTKYQN